MKSKGSLFLSAAIWVIGTCAHADTSTHVYECTINGQHVFSDHACGDNAVQRDVVVANHMDAVDAQTLKKFSKPVKPAHHRGHSSWDTRRQQCARVRKARDALVERMRAGYSAKQDERLHDRLRKLNDQYFELRCNGVS
ncbi:MAG TPA: hypothetical protein VG962_05880 [Steroidobacteraceae bacterium]|nr:hypothetical protein [Steroidobacteraceae bacterium]